MESMPAWPQHLRAHPFQAATLRPRECARAEAELGPVHPLVVVLGRYRTAVEQVATITVVQAADLFLLLQHTPLAVPVLHACIGVQIPLALRIAWLAAERRDVCRDLIIDGRQGLPLASVEREVDRLVDVERRASLAGSLDRLVDEAAQPGFGCPRCVVYEPALLRAVAEELEAVARALGERDAGVRGVALVESLLTSGRSPLHGNEVAPLREELGRARYFLAGRS